MRNKNKLPVAVALAPEKLRRFEKICRAFQLEAGEVLAFLASLVSIPGLLFPANDIILMASGIIHGYTDRLMYVEADACRRSRAIRYFRKFIKVYKSSARRPEKEQQWASIERAWCAEAGLPGASYIPFGKWLVEVPPGFQLHADFWQYEPGDLIKYFVEKTVDEACDPEKPVTAFLAACCHAVSETEFN